MPNNIDIKVNNQEVLQVSQDITFGEFNHTPSSDAVYIANLCPQIPSNRIEVLRNKVINNHNEIQDWNGYNIFYVTLLGYEEFVYVLNEIELDDGSKYSIGKVYFIDSNNQIFSYYDLTHSTVGDFIKVPIENNSVKVAFNIWRNDLIKNKIFFSDSDSDYVQFNYLSIIKNSNGTITVNRLNPIINQRYISPSKSVTFTIDSELAIYVLSLTENTYTPFIQKLKTDPDFRNLNMYVIKDTSNFFNPGYYDSRDILYQNVPYISSSGILQADINNVLRNEMTLKYPILNILGDSITAGGHYPNALKDLGYTVNNYGISGTTITTNKGNHYRSRVSNMTDNCDAVIVWSSSNDWNIGAPLGNFLDISDETKFYDALYMLFRDLKTKYLNKPIFICTTTHVEFSLSGYEDKWEYTIENGQLVEHKYGTNGAYLKEYVEATRKVAEIFSIPIIDLYHNSQISPIIDDYKTQYMPDGLHPNANGGILIANVIHNFLQTH